MEDGKIVDLLWQRDETALEKLKEKYGAYCYRVVNNILENNEDSNEVLNDVYLSVWNSVPPHRPQILSAFLGKIARNLSLKKWREVTAQKRGGGEVALVLDELSECIPDTNSVEDEMSARELSAIINTFLHTLPETERKIFVCRYWYHDSISDICKQFGFGQSRVKMSLLRSRQKLLKLLETKGVYL